MVRPSSPKLRFPDGAVPVVLGADRATEVLIPVEAQSNGTSSIVIEIVTPTGGQTVQGPVVMTARVNALSGLGQVVTGGAVLILVSWWYGHFRRRRRQRRAMLGEVDNPPAMESAALSPDAAEAVAAHVTPDVAPDPAPDVTHQRRWWRTGAHQRPAGARRPCPTREDLRLMSTVRVVHRPSPR